MKKTFLVLIAAIAAASSIQATEVPQSQETPRYVVSQERIDSMVQSLQTQISKEISRSTAKAVSSKTIASDTRTQGSAERASQARKIATASS